MSKTPLRIAITGSSGYLGSKLTQHFVSNREATVLGIDIQPPLPSLAPHHFESLDVTDAKLSGILEKFRPDTVIHAAFVFQPMRDEGQMHRQNLEGCRNVLRSVRDLGLQRLMVISSATAYGAWPDNPIPLDESSPLRATTFQYAADKTEVEALVQEFAANQPQIVVSCVRPAIIGGRGMDNYLTRFIFGMPFMVLIDGMDTPLQFVHEDDVVSAIDLILNNNAAGPFNIGPPSHTPLSEIAEHSGRRAVRLPFWLVRAVHAAAWWVRLPIHESPPSLLQFARYPWVVGPHRLQRELGFQFRFSSLETMKEIIAEP